MDDLSRAKALLARKLSIKGYLSQELFDWLIKKGVRKELADNAISTFCEQGYIDDEAWAMGEAKRWAARGKGPKWLSYHLAQKKLPPPLIAKALRSFSPDLEKIITKKSKGDYSPENRRKIVQFLYRRGFDTIEIERALQKINYD